MRYARVPRRSKPSGTVLRVVAGLSPPLLSGQGAHTAATDASILPPDARAVHCAMAMVLIQRNDGEPREAAPRWSRAARAIASRMPLNRDDVSSWPPQSRTISASPRSIVRRAWGNRGCFRRKDAQCAKDAEKNRERSLRFFDRDPAGGALYALQPAELRSRAPGQSVVAAAGASDCGGLRALSAISEPR